MEAAPSVSGSGSYSHRRNPEVQPLTLLPVIIYDIKMNKYIDLECAVCKKVFQRLLKDYKYRIKISLEKNRSYNPLCSFKCQKSFRSRKQIISCDTCNNNFEKKIDRDRKN